MKAISFFYNWNNKLDCKAFTTLRLSSNYEIGDKLEIILKKEPKGHGEIVDIKKLKLSDINEWVARIDTGYSQKECQDILIKMYKNKNVDWDTQIIYLILIRKI